MFLSEYLLTFTNNVEPDEMQHDAAFHLGFHCLQKCSFRGFPDSKLSDYVTHAARKLF